MNYTGVGQQGRNEAVSCHVNTYYNSSILAKRSLVLTIFTLVMVKQRSSMVFKVTINNLSYTCYPTKMIAGACICMQLKQPFIHVSVPVPLVGHSVSCSVGKGYIVGLLCMQPFTQYLMSGFKRKPNDCVVCVTILHELVSQQCHMIQSQFSFHAIVLIISDL